MDNFIASSVGNSAHNSADIALDWSDNYIGSSWTTTQNCYYWVSKVLLDLKQWELPLVAGLSDLQRAKTLIKEERQHWHEVAKASEHFDLIIMKQKGCNKQAYHVGLYTCANRGSILHAVTEDYMSLDTSVELEMRGFEIKRVLRHV